MVNIAQSKLQHKRAGFERWTYKYLKKPAVQKMRARCVMWVCTVIMRQRWAGVLIIVLRSADNCCSQSAAAWEINAVCPFKYFIRRAGLFSWPLQLTVASDRGLPYNTLLKSLKSRTAPQTPSHRWRTIRAGALERRHVWRLLLSGEQASPLFTLPLPMAHCVHWQH